MKGYYTYPRKASLSIRELRRDYENSRASFQDHIDAQEEYDFWGERRTIQDDYNYYGSGDYEDYSTIDPHYQTYPNFSWENSNPTPYETNLAPQQQAPTHQPLIQHPTTPLEEMVNRIAETMEVNEARERSNHARHNRRMDEIENSQRRMEAELSRIADLLNSIEQKIATPIVNEGDQVIEECCDIEKQPQRESESEADNLEIEASHNSDVGELLEEEEVETNNEKMPTKINETVLSLVEVVEKGAEQEVSMCEPEIEEKSFSNSFLVDVPTMINKWGSFDTFSSPLFHSYNQYYYIKFDNSHIYNTGFQVMEELEALGHGFKSVKWKVKYDEKHGPDTFPFDNG